MENPSENNNPTGNHPPPPSSPPPTTINDSFTWPELSSSGELSTLNTFPITIVSVPTTPESSPPPPPTTHHHHNAADVTVTTTTSQTEKEERGKSKGSGSAMECLVRVLEDLYGCEDELAGVDLLESLKRKGVTFPNNRGFRKS